MGAKRKCKRPAAVAARAKTKQSFSSEILPATVTPVSEKNARATTETMVIRGHAGAKRSKWPAIKEKLADQLKVERRQVQHVLDNIARGKAAAPRSSVAGRKYRLQK